MSAKLVRQADQEERPPPTNAPHLKTVNVRTRRCLLTPSASQRRSASVLIVDRSQDSREVLKTILEARGVSTFEAKHGAEGLEILREQHPRVVVVDLEIDESGPSEWQGAFQDESRRSDASLVMLGKVSRSDGFPEGDSSSADCRVIAKPYHYGPLIRTIEQLLQQQDAAA